jgi:hypothetical protein
MHHIFRISELLSLILGYHEDDKQTLAHIARTNRLLMLNALPLLWRSMNTLIPLLQLLPDDALTLERGPSDITDMNAVIGVGPL